MKTTQTDFGRFLKGPRLAAADDFASGDARRVVALSAVRGQATFMEPGGGIGAGAARINRTNLASAKRFAPGGRSSLKVIHSQAGERLAFWTGLQRARVRMAGESEKTTMILRVTEIFRQDKQGWKLIHRHADTLVKPAKPGRTRRDKR